MMDPKTTPVAHNILMVLLCALCAFWLLASPLVPVEFDPATAGGLAVFVATYLAVTAGLSAIGIGLNRMASHEARVTLRALLGPWRRRH